MNFQDLILEQLMQGKTQKEISLNLKKMNIKPNSQSSIEKELKKIRQKKGAKTNFHLGFIVGREKASL